MPSVVEDENTGVLVEPSDEESFVAALERILLDESLGRRFGEKGAEHVRSVFSLDRLVADIDALYQRLLHDAQADRAPYTRTATKNEARGTR
jgi:glycosyltransferase involved in cell wall biosynthesis